MEPIHLNVACGSKILSVSNEYPTDNSSMANLLTHQILLDSIKKYNI